MRPDRNVLSGPEGEVRVEPRTLRLLLRLAAKPGEVVSRRQLLDEVWPDTVVCENALSRAISELRRILGDDARSRISLVDAIDAEAFRKGLIADLRTLGDPDE